MALTPIERSLCNTLQQKFSPIVSTVQNTKSGFRDIMAEFSTGLRNTIFVNPWDVTAAVTDIQGQTQEVLPGDTLSDMDNLRRFMSNCEFMSGGGANAVGTILGGTLGVFGKIDGFIDGWVGAVPEIGLGKLADTLNRLLNDITIPGGNIIAPLLAQLDQIIECVADLCGPEYGVWLSQASTEVNDLYDDFNVVKDPLDQDYGKFNFTQVYSDVGLNPQEIANMDIATGGITLIKNGASDAIASAASAAKNLIGIGGFF